MRTGLLVAISIAAVSSAMADDWTASKLRGQVVQLVDNKWIPLQRGDVVPDTRYVATMATGHIELTRGGETIALDPNTQIRIFDKGGAKPFTTVKQDFGTVAVEAQVEQVQHFAVQTQYLAAVVKGTRFTVTVGKTGAKVDVHRGHVEVNDPENHTHTTIAVGQSAAVDRTTTAGAIEVSGIGTLPQVLDKKGDPVVPPDSMTLAKSADKDAQAALKKAEAAQKTADELGTKAAKDAAKAADNADKAAKTEEDGKGDGNSSGTNSNSDKGKSDGGSGNNGNGNGSDGDKGKSGGGGDGGKGKDKKDKSGDD